MDDKKIIVGTVLFLVVGSIVGIAVVKRMTATPRVVEHPSASIASSQPKPKSIQTSDPQLIVAQQREDIAALKKEIERLQIEKAAMAKAISEKASTEQANAAQKAIAEQKQREAMEKSGSVSGAAWLRRNDGSSDVQRGLVIYILKPEVSSTAVVGMLKAQIKYERREKAEDLKSAESYTSSDVGEPFRKLAAQHEDSAKAAEKIIPQIRGDMDVREAYELCRKSASMISFSVCAETAAFMRGKTDIEGKYTIADIPAGDWYLYAIINTKSVDAEWLLPLHISGNKLSIDLDNESMERR